MVVRCLGDIRVDPLLELSFERPASYVWNQKNTRRERPRNSVTVEWSFERDDASKVCHTKRQSADDRSSRCSGFDDDLQLVSESSGSVSLLDADVIDDGQDDDDSPWIPQLHLTKRDKKVLLSGEMLTDKHIFAAQKLLSTQAPHMKGLQDPILSQVGFSPIHKKSLQIHHTQGLHWVLSSWTPGDAVHVYDTLYDFVSDDLLHQLDEIYVDAPHTDDGHVLYYMPPVHKQLGSRDCGLFAVALATELCVGSDVSKVHFDQSKMRNHLYRCLRKRVMEPFPAAYIEL